MIKTSRKNLNDLFEDLNIPKNSNIMLHSSIFSLGTIEGGIEGLFSFLIDYIGDNGNLILPAFTYSFRRGEKFDFINTPICKSIGVFPEYVRLNKKHIRSRDPLFSMIAIGKDAEFLMKRETYNCFGEGSIYDKLFKSNTYFVGIGVSYSAGLTCFIHLEALANLDYRKFTKFEGHSFDENGQLIKDHAIHFCYEKPRKNLSHREKFGEILEENDISKRVKYGYSNHIAINGSKCREFSIEFLAQKPNFMYPY